MSLISPEDNVQGSASSNKTSGIEGNPDSKEGKVSYGDTTEEGQQQVKKEKQGILPPTGEDEQNGN